METFPRLAEEVYTVSRLTREMKDTLETNFPSVWVEGEISNFRVPTSGHFYFTLKDENSQIRVVMFRSRNQALPFLPDDGMQVTMRANLSVYPPRGEVQLVAEWMEPRGHGALQLAFEALKKKLEGEGLFDPERKKPLPFLPREIGLVTSPTGAAIKDILKVLWRRAPGVRVRFCPVRVQGPEAKGEIVDALEMLNLDGRAELIILARGGGSLEDLWAFNEEEVVRAVSASAIPVVSAVGHEIDFTIADFTADVRAPTPSAAAEIVVPDKRLLVQAHEDLKERLLAAAGKDLEQKRERLDYLARRMTHPGKRVQEGFVRTDELAERLRGAMLRQVQQLHVRVDGLTWVLQQMSPLKRIENLQERRDALSRDLFRLVTHGTGMKRQKWKEMGGRLESLSPLKVLGRGYSITRILSTGEILRRAADTSTGETVSVLLAEGELECTVKTVNTRPVKDDSESP